MSTLNDERARCAAILPTDAKCEACGESDPLVLNSDDRMILCAACDAIRDGRSTLEAHHIAGKANSPFTIPLPVNMHRRLSQRQRSWLSRVKRVPQPIRPCVAWLRGLGDLGHELADIIEKACGV